MPKRLAAKHLIVVYLFLTGCAAAPPDGGQTIMSSPGLTLKSSQAAAQSPPKIK